MDFTSASFRQIANDVLHATDNPAARYKIAHKYLHMPYEDDALVRLRAAFLKSDVVEQLEAAMLRHFGERAYQEGYFWDHGLRPYLTLSSTKRPADTFIRFDISTSFAIRECICPKRSDGC